MIRGIWVFFIGVVFVFFLALNPVFAEIPALNPYSEGVSLCQSKQYSAALPLFEKSVQEDPTSSALYYLGYCQYMVGLLKEADLHIYLSEKKRLNPSVKAYADRLKARLSETDQRWVEFQLALSDKNAIPPVDLFAEGVSLCQSKQYSAAIPFFEKSIAESSKASVYYYLGYCQYMAGMRKEADLNFYLSEQRKKNSAAKAYADRLKARLPIDDQKWVESYIPVSGQNFITNYEAINCDGHIRSDGNLVHLFRKFELNGHARVLVVDGQTLRVRLLDPEDVQRDPASTAEMNYSRYHHALEASSQFLNHLENNGMKHALPGAPTGVFLTADLCPNRHEGLEKRLFQRLERLHSQTHTTIPIGVSISGIWLRQHAQDFEYLMNLETRGVLKITWINHTYHHPYNPMASRSNAYNFLLMKKPHSNDEVLDLEKTLLEHGALPSAYFRFPGLVSNADWMNKIKNLSLITLGSDSWMAKGEEPRPGSIILIHANGNEPVGIDRFLSWLAHSAKTGPFLNLSELFPASSPKAQHG